MGRLNKTINHSKSVKLMHIECRNNIMWRRGFLVFIGKPILQRELGCYVIIVSKYEIIYNVVIICGLPRVVANS